MAKAAAITLTTPLEEVAGIGPKTAAALATLGVTTVARLIAHLPSRHERLEAEADVREITPDQNISARGEITATRVVRGGRRPRFEAVLLDDTGRLDLVWFNATYLHSKIMPGHRLRVQGKARRHGPGFQVANPQWEFLSGESEPAKREARVRPVYPANEHANSRLIESAASKVLDAARQIPDHLPEAFRKARRMPELSDAYHAMHAPASEEEATAARRRLAYDELLLLQLGVHMKRAHLRSALRAPPLRWDTAVDRHIRGRLPFSLTESQDRVVAEIGKDLSGAVPTNRLIQGDVGSGKTVVALYAMLMAVATPRGIAFPGDDSAPAVVQASRPSNPPPIVRTRSAHLPHWRQDGATYSVAFRLGDSLPGEVLDQWRREREHTVRRAEQAGRSLTEQETTRLNELYSERIEAWLDRGHGSCIFRDDRFARIVRDALFHFDGQRYEIIAWCVMPNHVHVVVRVFEGEDLSKVLQSWKGFTSRKARSLLGESEPGGLWQRETYDHPVRGDDDLHHQINYVLKNPEKAGLNGWEWVGRGSAKSSAESSPGKAMPRGGHQAALMAPTELLAEQHSGSITRLLAGSRVRVELLTGSRTRAERQAVLAGLESGDVDVVVGTHALLTEGVKFRALGVVIVDEQHRFGVHHRAALRTKGADGKTVTPHMLVMTATPIPRTMAITLFGDLDISTIDTLPPGRTPVATEVARPADRPAVYRRVREELDAGRQAYIVVPAIEGGDSGAENVRSLLRMLEQGELAGKRLAALHGRLKPSTRDHVMGRFRAGLIDALVATTVVEVGVDVPNATVMVVESAERFGLAQLHQLRGRVGRGQGASRCILIADPATPEAQARLDAITRTTDGFALAEKDFELRGPGELFGTRQAGAAPFRVADLSRDLSLLRMARRDAADWIARSPALDAPEESILLKRLLKAHGESLGLGDVG